MVTLKAVHWWVDRHYVYADMSDYWQVISRRAYIACIKSNLPFPNTWFFSRPFWQMVLHDRVPYNFLLISKKGYGGKW